LLRAQLELSPLSLALVRHAGVDSGCMIGCQAVMLQ
jgi:hypothetical protein